MIIGYNNIAVPSAWSDAPQGANVLLTVRFTVNVKLLLDGTTDVIGSYMWSAAGTPNAKNTIYKWNPVTGQIDKVVETAQFAINTTPGWRLPIAPTCTLDPGNVYHFGMYCASAYNMKFFNPTISGDSYETQSRESGLTFPTLPASITQDPDLSVYGVSSAIYVTGTEVTSGKKIQGILTMQGISTIQL